MINRDSTSRKAIIDYLDEISEDDFINEVIIPLFAKQGYSLIRKVSHGPGENGKDVIFSKYHTAFNDHEYLVVQAKSKKVTASNVSEFAMQLIRALRTPITGLNGATQVFSNYVVFMNSRGATNDAVFEFPYLVDGKNNIKLIQQDQVYELMVSNNIVPSRLEHLITSEPTARNDHDREVISIVCSNQAAQIEHLFNVTLPAYRDISTETKAIVIEYIFHRWSEDQSWEGTTKPMKWLAKYFNFLQEYQYPYLRRVVDEYLSRYSSNAAWQYTVEVVRKLTPSIVQSFMDGFIERITHLILDGREYPDLYQIVKDINNPTFQNNKIKTYWPHVKEYVEVYLNDESQEKYEKLKDIKRKLRECAFPS